MAQVYGPDGKVHVFPDSWSPQAQDLALRSYYGPQGGGAAGQRPNVPGLTGPTPSPAGGSLREMSTGVPDTPSQQSQGFDETTKLLPYLGSTIGLEGTAVGMLAHQALSKEGPSAGSAIGDAMGAELIPRAAVGLVKGTAGFAGSMAKRMVDATNNPAIKDWVTQNAARLSPGSLADSISGASANSKDIQAFRNSPAGRESPNSLESGPLFTGQPESISRGGTQQQLSLRDPDTMENLFQDHGLPDNSPAAKVLRPSPSLESLRQQDFNTIPTQGRPTSNSPIPPNQPPDPLKSNIARLLQKLPGSEEIPTDIYHSAIQNKALDDVTQVRSYKLAGGDADALARNNVVNKSFNSVKQTFDPKALLDEIGGTKKEVYNEALTPESKQNLTDFANKVQQISKDPSANNGLINYTGRRIMFHIAAVGGGAAIGGLPGVALGEGALVLGSQALKQMAKSPIVGKMAIKALETPASSEISPIVQKTILNGLRGASLTFKHKDGSEEPVTIGPNGQLQGDPEKP